MYGSSQPQNSLVIFSAHVTMHWVMCIKLYKLVYTTEIISQRCFHLNSNLPVSVLGHGVVAHKAIKDLCTLAGIKDIYVKIEGNTKNKITLTHAFFNAMTHQVCLIQNGDKV